MSRVAIIIPTLNEEKNLLRIISNLIHLNYRLVFVDGKSTDNSLSVIRTLCPDVTVLIQKGEGKGSAIIEALNHIEEEFVLTIDADGSHDTNEIDRFIRKLNEGFDVVAGSRYLRGGGSEDLTAVRKIGNKVLVKITNVLYGSRLTDLCYGFRAYRTECLRSLDLKCSGFNIDAEIMAKSLKSGLKVAEVPSFERRRQFGNSKMHALRDGLRILSTIVKVRFSWNTKWECV